MTPKEKANELVDNFWLMDKVIPMLSKEQAKQCALIAVDEILLNMYNTQYDIEDVNNPLIRFWNDVKKEIELL